MCSSDLSNIVLLGACSHLLGIEKHKIEDGIKRIFAKKGQDIIDINIKAFNEGSKFSGLL